MKFLANENFPFTSVTYLRNKGFDILSVGADYKGISDREIIKLANKEERTILTFDSGYGTLIFRDNLKPEKGVIYFRIKEYQPDEPGKILEHLTRKYDFMPERKLTVVDNTGIRQKNY
ncbi:MAG TPA: DUF5615 family PIN-like protein [Bacteroidia bacterium]|nr:DUF5615 family PIN-like protein [Bacteroidia bacterium]